MKNFLLFQLFLLSSLQAQAQLVAGDTMGLAYQYVGLTVNAISTMPDQTIFHADSLDLNGDGQLDLEFVAATATVPDNYSVNTFLNKLNDHLEFLTDNYGLPLQFQNGEQLAAQYYDIGYPGVILASAGVGIAGYFEQGPWVDVPIGYLGIRYIDGLDTLYGWIQLEVTLNYPNGAASVQVIDYVLGESEEQPNAVQTVLAPSIFVVPNPASDKMKVYFGQLKPTQISLYNSTGQQVWKQSNPTGRELEIELTGLPMGIYSLCIQEKGTRYTKQVLIVQSQ